MSDDRRTFIAKLLMGVSAAFAGSMLPACNRRPRETAAKGGRAASPETVAKAVEPEVIEGPTGDLSWITGESPYDTTREAVARLGGMGRFVAPGETVAMLLNVSWARTMEQGANTHPEVARALIDMCSEAGAKSITAFCHGCNTPALCLEMSGIGKMIDESVAHFEHISRLGWRKRKAPSNCTFLESTDVYRLVEDCDVFINAPVAKHHGMTPMTVCCKNLMGAIKEREICHQSLDEAIADLVLLIPCDLSVLDCSRVIIRNGPGGGDLNDVVWMNTVIAGTNPVEVDVLGATLFGMRSVDIKYFRLLHERGQGEIDIKKLNLIQMEI